MKRADFLARVQQAAGLTTVAEAERWAFEVFVALSHLLTESEQRRHFFAQLPGFLKSRLLAEPPQGLVMDRDAFVQHVASRLDTRAPEAERAVRAVWHVAKDALSPGQAAEFEAHIPKDVAAFLG